MSSGGGGCRVRLLRLRFAAGPWWNWGDTECYILWPIFLQLLPRCFSWWCLLAALRCFTTQVCVSVNWIACRAHGGKPLYLVSQLCAQRSASTVAACPPIRASASRDGEDWTALVVGALQLLHNHICCHIDLLCLPKWHSQTASG